MRYVILLSLALTGAGCALVTHDMGAVRQPRPNAGAASGAAITEDVGARLRKENPSVKRFVDDIDHLQSRVALARVTPHETCVDFRKYALPSSNRFTADANPLESHRLYLVRSAGQTLQSPNVSGLETRELLIRYITTAEVVTGRDRVRGADGRPVATVERTELADVEDSVKLFKYQGTACFAHPEPFLAPDTKWVRLSLRAKLYARDYTFEFE